MRDLEMEEEMRINFHNSFINWFNRTKSNRNSFIAFSSPADSDSNDYLNFKGSHFLNASDTGDGSVCSSEN